MSPIKVKLDGGMAYIPNEFGPEDVLFETMFLLRPFLFARVPGSPVNSHFESRDSYKIPECARTPRSSTLSASEPGAYWAQRKERTFSPIRPPFTLPLFPATAGNRPLIYRRSLYGTNPLLPNTQPELPSSTPPPPPGSKAMSEFPKKKISEIIRRL